MKRSILVILVAACGGAKAPAPAAVTPVAPPASVEPAPVEQPVEAEPTVPDQPVHSLAPSDGGDMSKRMPGGTLQQVEPGGKGPDVRVGTGRPRPPPDKPDKPAAPKPELLGRISAGRPVTQDASTLTPDAVLAKINSAYMAGVRRCYSSHLAKSPAARGRVTLTLPIDQRGRVAAAKVRGFAAAVDECITGLTGSWTFPPPKEVDSREATEATFEVVLHLVPD